MSPYQNHATMQDPIAKWQFSALSQADYCKEHGIKPHIFSYYKKKFTSNAEPVKPSSQLIPVKLLTDDESVFASRSSGCNVLRLTHANGFTLEINPYADMSSLKPLLELLRSVP